VPSGARGYDGAVRPFPVSRARLARAIAHGEAMARDWNTIPDEDLYTVRPAIDPTGYGQIRLVANKPVPKEFSLRLGEMLYHLRSALDAAIYQAAVYTSGKNPPPDDTKLEFPICIKPEDFPGLAKRKMGVLPQAVQDGIEKVQPYNIGCVTPEEMVTNLNRSLGILNELARKDRHRTLHIIGAWAHKIAPVFVLPDGVTLSKLDIMPSGYIGSETVLATFQLTGFQRGMGRIQANPMLALGIGVDEPPASCHANDTFDRRLTEMINAVGSVIDALENYY
jgi:hypothetical protein